MPTNGRRSDENIRTALQEDLEGNFDRLVHMYKPYIWQIAFGMIQQKEETEDVCQEVFTNAYRYLKRHGVEAVEKLKPWLGTIARHETDKYRKKRQPDRDLIRPFSRDEPEDTDIADTEKLEDTVRGHTNEQKHKEAISKLPEPYRSVIILYLQGYRTSEIAKRLRYREGTVKSIINRGKRLLLLELINLDALPKLPECYRSVVELHLQGYTNKKIEEQLGKKIMEQLGPKATIKSTLSHGIHLLIELSEDF